MVAIGATVACTAPTFDGRIERFSFSSGDVMDRFAVDVFLPANDTNTGFRALYVLDGTEHAETVAMLVQTQGYPVAVVGVGYESDRAKRRVLDYTPTEDDQYEQSGGADTFVAFLAEDLIPFMEASFPIARRKRALFGHALGGLAATHIALTQDEHEPLFDAFVAASPALWWDRGAILDTEAAHLKSGSALDFRLFIATGEMEPVTVLAYADALVARLRERADPALSLVYLQYEDSPRNRTWRRTYTDALSLLYEDN
ncbi:MAG: alpha/beta hydrolase-fold protein [Nannocystaceae bacterium]